MWLLYRLAFGALLLGAAPVLLLARRAHYRATLRGRLGLDPGRAPARCDERSRTASPLWIHAVSVGEVGVASALAAALPDELPLVVTTVTPTGQERARKTFEHRAHVAYLPFDLRLPVERFLSRHEPRGLVLVEGEFWPLLLHRAEQRGMPIVLVNGRISDRSFRRQTLLAALFGKRLLRPLYGAVHRFGVQSEVDRDRLLALGLSAERVVTTGNLKYESPTPARNPELEEQLRQLAAGRAILVAGSTMADPRKGRSEENLVLDAYEHLGTERALLVLAPRHPERFDEVFELAETRDLRSIRRSRLDSTSGGELSAADIVVLDTLGDLAGLYATADGAFVGGTLVPTGGHNPLEPAGFATPIAVGPSMHNFREMAQQFDRALAWQRVDGAEQLARCWAAWIEDPSAARSLGERALQLIEDNRGALDATIELLASTEGLLPREVAREVKR